LILSFFPFLIFLVTLIGFLSLSGDSFTQQLIRVVPSDTGKSIQAILTEVTIHRSGTLLSLGILTTLWAASNGVKAIIKGLNKAYDEEETRPFWKVRGIAVLATIVLAIVLIIAMVLLVFGEVIGQYVFRFLNVPTGTE
jgi:membrane protein